MAADAKPWFQQVEERRERGKKAAALAAQHKLHLTESVTRAWYEDQWTETVVDWSAVADLLDKVAPGWDTAPGVLGPDDQTFPQQPPTGGAK